MLIADQKKNVLFVQGRFTVGGVERVTILLANAFVRRGWCVGLAVFKIEERAMLQQLDSRIVVREIGFPAYRWRSVSVLKDIMRELGTTHIINQWAFPFPVTLMLRLARPRKTRLVSVFHTMPNKSRRIQEAAGIKQRIVSWLVRINSRLVYRFSDAYIVLSKCYEDVFREFTGIVNTPKMFSIPNPVVRVNATGKAKENVILYVGRLTATEKRVERVIETWRRVANRLSDWRLEILGDGPARAELEDMSKELSRITFRGFQKPDEYYAKAKILLLTSDFEGFPMTLVEAMSAGCVPVVYGSFLTAHDIVQENTGVVVPMPWDTVKFAAEVESLMRDEERRERMADAAKLDVGRFDIDKVVDEYIHVLA